MAGEGNGESGESFKGMMTSKIREAARDVVCEEISKCLMGNTHETQIDSLKKEMDDMKDTNKEIFSKLDGINGKFLVVAGATILQLLTIVGVLFAWVIGK
jgi:hypothetical protein